MIVVDRLVGLPGVVHDAVHERDAALGDAIGELEVVKHRQPGGSLQLCVAHDLQPRGVPQRLRDEAVGGRSRRRRLRRHDGAVPSCTVSRTAAAIRTAAKGSGTDRVPRACCAVSKGRRIRFEWSKTRNISSERRMCPGHSASTESLRLVTRKGDGSAWQGSSCTPPPDWWNRTSTTAKEPLISR